MADINLFLQENNSFISTFNETSYDSSNDEHLCKDTTVDVLNFDRLIEDRYPDSNSRPKSFDAIFVYEEDIFCIEFKNQKTSNINNQEVQLKIKDGKSELDKLLKDKNIQVNKYRFIYCVVYKICTEPYDRYKCGIAKNSVLFGLDSYKKNSFVDKVITQNVAFYTKELKKLFEKELIC
jgi:hypothetical protein